MTDWNKMTAQVLPGAIAEVKTPWGEAQPPSFQKIGAGGLGVKWPVELKVPETIRIYNNKMPTHDPYSNPNALIYYQCGCGAILDPLTKSFASLNNHASNMGWKIRFGETGYIPYCVECGKDVE